MNHSGGPSIRAIDVWDVLFATITTVGSVGLMFGYGSVMSVSDELLMSADTLREGSEVAFTKIKEFQVFAAGK
ncbi:unnamed protein product, partial [marine sediment metagenome]